MDELQKPQPTEPVAQPMGGTPPPPAYTAPAAPPAPVSEPRNFLATFLLACYGGLLGLRHFYLGQKTLGLVRLGLFVGYFALLILGSLAQSAVLMFLGLLSFVVAYIWAIVDFFVVYLSVKTDAEGQPLTRTHRDAKWAKVIFMVTVIIAAILFIGGIVVGVTGENLLKKSLNDSTNSRDTFQLDENTSLEDYNSNFNFDSNSTYDF